MSGFEGGGGLPPAAWYPDPAGSGGLRYWDGAAWTEHVTPPPQPAAPPAGHILPTPPQRSGVPVVVWIVVGIGVVLVGMAVLAAVAIPTFLGAQERAQDRAAQSNLRNALTAARTVYSGSGSYSSADASSLGSIEPSIVFTSTESDRAGVVSVAAGDQRVTVASLSDSGTCWVIDENLAAGAAGFRTGRLQDGQPCHAAVGGGGLIIEQF